MGTPTTVTPGGTSRITAAPAPTVQRLNPGHLRLGAAGVDHIEDLAAERAASEHHQFPCHASIMRDPWRAVSQPPRK